MPIDLPKDLVIELINRDFSNWKHHEEEALTYVGSLFKMIDHVRKSDPSSLNPPFGVEFTYIDTIIEQIIIENWL